MIHEGGVPHAGQRSTSAPSAGQVCIERSSGISQDDDGPRGEKRPADVIGAASMAAADPVSHPGRRARQGQNIVGISRGSPLRPIS